MKKIIEKSLKEVQDSEAEVDQKVYEDTKSAQSVKADISQKIDDLDKEIEQLEKQLMRCRQSRQNLLLEREVYEKQIFAARGTYQSQINKN